MRTTPLLPAALLLGLLATPSPARAVDAPARPAIRPTLERFDGSTTSTVDAAWRGTARWDRVPRGRLRAWSDFVADVGTGWRGSFDDRTGVPSRLYGPGVSTPGAVASAPVAAQWARTLLARHVALLAPGADPADFELVSNDLDRGQRTVGFVQRHRGLRVRGGQVSFRFKGDRLFVIGSEAVPVEAAATTIAVDGASAERAARAWLEPEFGRLSTLAIAPAELLPFRNNRGQLDVRAAIPVRLRALDVTAQYTVWVDAASGQPIAREQELRFGSGSVRLNVPERSPSFGGRIEEPAALAKAVVNGAAQKTTALGELTWDGADPAQIALSLDGDRVRVLDASGPEIKLETSLENGQSFLWDVTTEAPLDAQLTTFVHGARAREYARSFALGLTFLNQPVKATVNIDDVCNAYSDGTTINFFRAGSGCENTGRIADVVYHEYGHSLHNHAVIEGVGAFEGALSEGISDYFAGTITGDHGMGRGFFLSDQALRDLDPDGFEARWPEDLVGQVHKDGEIIGQALWDLRKALVDKYGTSEGVATSDVLFYQGIRRAVDIPSMYVEVLAADDDDGDLSNGTPNVCEINRAFGAHGLRAVGVETTNLGIEPPNASGFDVAIRLNGLFGQCGEDALQGALLSWRERDNPAESGTVTMNAVGPELQATIPTRPEGTVVRYFVNVTFNDGDILALPDNAADNAYEFYVGEVTPLYCTDFESDPEAEGWTHGLASGEDTEGADDWQWGDANGNAINGDPAVAFSGDKVFGNDLAPKANYNGLYQPDKTNWARTPIVDVAGYEKVRLQYRRWLNIEDGFFDRASVRVGDAVLWTNFGSDTEANAKTHHRDREWRFHDVDLTESVAADETVQVTFELASDGGLEFGGWTIDDVCIVGVGARTVDPCAAGGCGEGGAGAGGGGGGAGGGESPTEDTVTGGCDCAVSKPSTNQGAESALLTGFAAALAMVRRRRRRAITGG